MTPRLRTYSPRVRFLVASALAFAVGLSTSTCGNSTLGGDDANADAGTDQPKTLLFLTVSPDNDVLKVDVNTSAQKTFKVFAHYSDGEMVDVSDRAAVSLDNQAVGSLVGLTFTSAQSATAKVGFTKINASLLEGDKTATGYANLTVVWLRMTGATTDFFFELPHGGSAQDQPLQFGTNVQSLDSFFAVDTTGSMGPSIQALKNSLTNTIIPGVKANAAKDAQFGVAAVEDFPVSPYGVANYYAGLDDQALVMLRTITSDVTAASNAVAALLNGSVPRGNGNDLPEGQMEALYQLATGAGNVVSGYSNIPANTTGIGGAGFRKGALPVITMISDAHFHTKGESGSCVVPLSGGGTTTIYTDFSGTVATIAHSRTETHAALNKICAKVVGVSALRTNITGVVPNPNGICPATPDLVAAAKATGAVVLPVAWDAAGRPTGCASNQCCTGLNGVGEATDANGECPLVFKIPQDGSGLGSQVVSGITQVARYSKFDVTTQTTGNPTGDQGEPMPTGKTTADFIKSITPKDSSAPPAPPTLPGPVISGNSFTKVYPGSTVRFTVTAENTLVQQTGSPQIFRAKIKVLAGGCADLDEREVIILIPPKAPVVG